MSRSPDSGFAEKMRNHSVNGVTALAGDPSDKASEIIGYVHSLTCYMSALVADPHNYRGPHLEREIDLLNKQIVVGAFDALSYLAALADFYISEIE